MNRRFARLETQLEHLIEGAFTQLFSRSLRPGDLVLALSRALETGILPAADGDPRPIAPDRYVIRLNDGVQTHLLLHQPDLPQLLSQHLVDLAALAGYRLLERPRVRFEAVPAFTPTDIRVRTEHVHQPTSTAVMQPVTVPPPQTAPPAPAHLIIDGSRTETLGAVLLNLGRARDNDIVIDDAHVSRHHAQMRLRFGSYILFDRSSQSGTFVNEVAVREHPLQSGDVIRLGRTQLVYLQEAAADLQGTAPLPPLTEPD